MNEVVLIDLSSIAYPVYKMSAGEPDPNAASTKMVARVRALSAGHDHVAICCDSGRSFRADIASTYKAQRPERDEVLHHQIALACEQFKKDGYPLWAQKGYEADDIIATVTAKVLQQEESRVIIVTADKDLLQLVGPRVVVKSTRDGAIVDAEAVGAKFGVRPDQMCDYLTLVGDVADNIKGADGIGEKKAADLLTKWGTLDNLYRELAEVGAGPMGLTPAMAKALTAFKADMPTTRSLISLRTDATVPYEELMAERVPEAAEAPTGWNVPPMAASTSGTERTGPDQTGPSPVVSEPDPGLPSKESGSEPRVDRVPEPARAPAPMVIASPQAGVDVLGPETDYERQLDPRNLEEARTLAMDMFQARLFSSYGTPQAILSTVMVGREMGIPAMASLRGIHIVEGKHALSSALIVGLVLKSGLAEFFEPLEFDETKAVFETKRKGARNAVKLTYTLEMAKTAGLVKPNSNWVKSPMAMCIARAQAMLARLIYPDLLAGVYTPEELEELRAA